MRTIGEVIKLSKEFLKNRRVAEEIISHVLGMKRLDLYLQHDKPIVEWELNQIREMIKRCAKHEPPEYVIGKVDFFGCQIRVDHRVLIPRPETEILVEKVSKIAKNGTLWDLCTGSGCIGIALKKANPDLKVVISDISKEALKLASENAKSNGAEVLILHGDLLEPFKGQKCDFIICNPPYVTEGEYAELDPSVRNFEPKLALIGGLDFYKRLKSEMDNYLNPGGQFFFEMGASQAGDLLDLFPNAVIEKDWAGHPRFLFSKIFF